MEQNAQNTAPRVTPADIEAEIASEHYFTGFDGALGALSDTDADPVMAATKLPPQLEQVTFCVMVLSNGAKVAGINYGAISPENHSAEIGKAEARKDAVDKVYELLGFRLRDQLAKTA